MSHCANYILVVGGERLTTSTRWGAQAVPWQVFWGPDRAFDFIVSLVQDADDDERVTYLYDELMCEAAAYVDADRQRLLVFGGEDMQAEKPLQHAYVEMLRCSWEGWRVDWAFGGMAQVAAEAGVTVGPEVTEYLSILRCAWALWRADWARDRMLQLATEYVIDVNLDDPKTLEWAQRCWNRRWTPQTTAYRKQADGSWRNQPVPGLWNSPITEEDLYFGRSKGALTVVTTREPAGVVDRPLGTDPVLTLARGPLLAEELAGHPPIEPVPALHGAKGGAYIDRDERTIHYWLGREEPSWLPQLLADAWPGWTFRRNVAALTGHFTLTGRDPAPVWIDPDILRRYVLRHELRAAADFRAINNLVAELAERGKRPGVALAPGVLRAPRLNVDASERDLMIASILARLQA